MEKTDNKDLDTLKVEIANLREDINKIFGTLKNYAETKVSSGISAEKEQIASYLEKGHQLWTNIINKADSTKTKGKKVAKDTITKVEDHPLITIMVSLGIGYVISKVLTRNETNENANDDK